MANLPLQISEQTSTTAYFSVAAIWTFTFLFYTFWFLSKLLASSAIAAMISLALCIVITASVLIIDAVTTNKDALSSTTLLILLPGLVATKIVDTLSYKSFIVNPLTCPLSDIFDSRNKIEFESIRWSLVDENPVAIIQLRHDSLKDYRATRAFILKLDQSNNALEESIILKTQTEITLLWPYFQSAEQMIAVDAKLDSFLRAQTDLFQLRGLWLKYHENNITGLAVEYSNSDLKPETVWKSWTNFLTDEAHVAYKEKGLVDPGSTRGTTWGQFNNSGDQFIYGSEIDTSTGFAKNEILIHFINERAHWKTKTVQTHVDDDLTLSPAGAFFDQTNRAYTLAFNPIDRNLHVTKGLKFPSKADFILQIPIEKQVEYNSLTQVQVLNASKILIAMPYADFKIFNLDDKTVDSTFWQNAKASLNMAENKMGGELFFKLESTPTKKFPYYIVRKNAGLFLLDQYGHLKMKWAFSN